MTFLKTARTQLRNLLPTDRSIIHAYRNDESCARFQRWKDASIEAVDQMILAHSQDIFPSLLVEQHYAIADLRNQPIGDLSVFYTAQDRCITLGLTIAPQHQHRGLARELLSAVIRTLHKNYPDLELVALISPDNTQSIHLFEALGFEKECYAPSIDSLVYVIKGYLP